MSTRSKTCAFLVLLAAVIALPVAAWAYTQADCDTRAADALTSKNRADSTYIDVENARTNKPCPTSVALGQDGYTNAGDVSYYNGLMSSYSNSMVSAGQIFTIGETQQVTGAMYYYASQWNSCYATYSAARDDFDTAYLNYAYANDKLTAAWNDWLAHGN